MLDKATLTRAIDLMECSDTVLFSLGDDVHIEGEVVRKYETSVAVAGVKTDPDGTRPWTCVLSNLCPNVTSVVVSKL